MTARPPGAARKDISLHPVVPEDIPALYGLCCSGSNGATWRYAGTTPSPAIFAATLWDGVSAQFKVLVDGIPGISGLVVLYDEVGNHGKVGTVFTEPLHLTGFPMMALGLFLEHVFATRSVGKVYFETSQPLEGTAIHDLLRLEGALTEHVFVLGKWCTQYVYALTRASWLGWCEEQSTGKPESSPPDLEEFIATLFELLGPTRHPHAHAALIELELDSLDALMIWNHIESIVPNWPSPVPLDQLLHLTVAELHHLVVAAADRQRDQTPTLKL